MLVYEAAGRFASALAMPVRWLAAQTGSGRDLRERLGELPAAVRAVAHRGAVWVHAASVGEVLAAGPLIDALHAHRPMRPIIVSATSLPGREAARTLNNVDGAMLLPVDIRRVVTATLAAVRPAVLVVMETEIWPALLQAAAAAGVPVVVASGCISARSARRYALIRPLLREVFGCVSAFGMQTAADAERVIALGAASERVRVTGSLKYARLAPPPRPDGPPVLPGSNGRPLLIAASTQPGEEQVVIEACAGVWRAHPECLLVLAPRRPERFDEVDHLLADAGVRRERRSRVKERLRPDTQVVLLDSLGELPGLLGGARAVFVGGTLAPVGGHNVLEPAAAAAPVCFGPHTENVAEAAEALLRAGGAVRVHDARELAAEWCRVLAAPVAARAMGARAREVVRAGAAVVDDTCALVESVLP